LAGLPKYLIETPARPSAGSATDKDVLSDVLRSIRISGSVQFCFMPGGAWETDASPSPYRPPSVMPFHILAEGTCWVELEGERATLRQGDVVAFPQGTGHMVGAGTGGRLLDPGGDLPPKPWREVPILRYGQEHPRVRLICGYLQCEAVGFRLLRDALPRFIHIRTAEGDDAGWFTAMIAQIVAEIERPRAGGLSVLERLTETIFIELLRRQVISGRTGSTGWLAALADPSLGRCLALIHDDPRRDWSVQDLAAASGVSRSTLAERFEAVLATSPMRYVLDWRLCLASVALSTTSKPIGVVAHEAGYGTEAAFSRAFSRAYGTPPAAWRQNRH
jgi:AraC-like DNA-binding protein